MDHSEQRTSIEDEVIPKIFPYISLCDIESLSEATGVEYSYEFGLNIEGCCLAKHPVDYRDAIYREYGEKTTSLTLQDIHERDARKILKHFTAVKRFTMRNMLILESIDGFPMHLSCLTILDCEIKESLRTSWIERSKETLTHLHLDNLVVAYHPVGVRLWFRDFKSLTSLRLNGSIRELNLIGHKVKFLHLRATDSIKALIKCPNLTHLHFDVPSDSDGFFDTFNSAKLLESLTTRNWIDPEHLSEFALLTRLEILWAVPSWIEPEVEKLGIAEVKVHFEPTSDDPDLIFEMLNEYCLLEIISFLPARDWIPFATLHQRVEWAVASYKYPRAKIDLEDLPVDLFKDIAPLVRNIRMSGRSRDRCGYVKELTALKSLTLSRINPDPEWTNELPVGLERLMIHAKRTQADNISSGRKQLSPSLRVLETNIILYEKYLLDLENLREIKLEWIWSIKRVNKVLKRNLETLERVELSLRGHDGKSVLKLMHKMPKLNVIGINGLIHDDNEVHDILRDIGPKLKKLSVTVEQEPMIDVLRSGCFDRLEELDVGVSKANHEKIVAALGLGSLKTLRKLRIYCSSSGSPIRGQDSILQDPMLVEILMVLPRLSEIIVPTFASIPFGHEPRQFLKGQKRTLRIREYSTNSFVDVP